MIRRQSGHGQDGFRCRHEWGRLGVRAAAKRGDIVVVVDTLRFSTAVAAGVDKGAWVYPCATVDQAAELQARVGGTVAGWPPESGYSLSPHSYICVRPFERIILPSPNGATCSGFGSEAPYLFVASLVNASAVAAAVSRLMHDFGMPVTVVSCGERREDNSEGEGMRPAIEDYLGAGAVLARLPGSRSPEAELCAAAFETRKDRLDALLWECESGRELRAKGLGHDVRFAAELDCLSCVPELWGSEFLRQRPEVSRAGLLCVVALMETFPHPWWVAGGWAIDLLVGEPYRQHEDIEIGVDRRHQQALQAHLAGRQLFKAAPTVEGKPWDIVPWEVGERLELPLFQVMARDDGMQPPEFEFFLNEIENGKWCFRRDPSIRLPMSSLIVTAPGGIPVLAPEAQLLHKAQRPRPKDHRDFERVLPLLSSEQRAWLRTSITKRHPKHPWLAALDPDAQRGT